MKAAIVVLLPVFVMMSPMTVRNANSQVELMVGGGLNGPLGDYGDQAKIGWAFMTGAGLRIAKFVSLGAEIGFYGSSAQDEMLEGFSPETELSMRIEQYAGTAKILIPVQNHNLFAKGLIGSYRGVANVSSPLGDASVSNTDLGYGFGGGVMINGERNSSFFLDVTYHTIDFDGADSKTHFISYSAGAIVGINLFD